MTIVTGDRYLDLLSTFVEANTGPLLDGGLLLKLHPVGLHYLQTRFEALEELESLRIEAPVDYLRAYVADLGDHRALELLRRMLRLLSSVKVVAMVTAPFPRDHTRITLLPFSRLRSLELRGCDLSTSAARGLLQLRPILEKLVCDNSADALRHIFSDRTKEILDAPVWSRLADVSCFGNGMLLMDESLQLLPAVEALDLSRNRFAKVANLQKCSKLMYLDAGFNHITTVASLNKILRGITKLVLRNNALVSTRGLHRIASLEALDLSYNLISNFCEVELLGELPSLHLLWLEGNPLTFGRFYRNEALSYFSDPSKLVLDGKQTSRGEICAARRLFRYRLKQQSKYGTFTPAKVRESSDSSLQLSDTGELDGANLRAVSNDPGPSSGPSALQARKKSSRLASITDITGLQSTSRAVELLRESSFNSTSLDSASAVQNVAESKEQIEEMVQDLIQRTEGLKRAGSSSWLKDLNVLLASEAINKSQVLAEIQRMDSDARQRSPLWQKRRRRRSIQKGTFGESMYVSGNPQGSDKSEKRDEAETNLARLSHETSARWTSKEALSRHGSGYVADDNGLQNSNLSTASLDELLRASVDSDEPGHNLSGDLNYGGELNLNDQSGTFGLTEELLTGKMLVGSSSSPPQFNQDILHRRQNLERELLKLPPEQDILSFHDSESTSETIHSHLSDSSDSPHHSPSTVWQPFRFDDCQKSPSSQGGKSDSDDNFQVWSDTEAPEQEALESGEPDDKDRTGAFPRDEGIGPGGRDPSPPIHSVEGTKPPEKDTLLVVHDECERGTEPAGKSPGIGVPPEEGNEAGGKDITFGSHAEDQNLEMAHDLVAGHSASNSWRRDGLLIGDISNTSPQKENLRGYGKLLRSRSPNVLHPKSKSSRRIVQLESLPGVLHSTPSNSNESTDIQEQSLSSGISSPPGQVLQRSVSNSVLYSKPFTITRNASSDADVNSQREWSLIRSHDESLPSSSLQRSESLEAAESSLQFHRVHHAVGPFVGQCA